MALNGKGIITKVKYFAGIKKMCLGKYKKCLIF